MNELPQWAVDEADALAAVAMETLLSMPDQTVEDRGVWLSEFLARALADAAKPKWQPIESAPKDGTEVLIRIKPKVIRLGWYFKRSGRTEGWCDENGNDIRPTHWMPLPGAPEVG